MLCALHASSVTVLQKLERNGEEYGGQIDKKREAEWERKVCVKNYVIQISFLLTDRKTNSPNERPPITALAETLVSI